MESGREKPVPDWAEVTGVGGCELSHSTRAHLSGLKGTCLAIPVTNTRDLFVGNVTREHAAQQVEALKPDLLPQCMNCSSQKHAACQVQVSSWHAGVPEVCVCLCVFFSVLVYEHVKMCLQGLDKSSSTTLTPGLKG